MPGPVRVLVVDDSAVVRAVVCEVLEEDPQIEVIGTAANGRIALDMVARLEPDLLILDIEMPVMDGLETLRELRRLYPHLPVIMFSSLADGPSVMEALSRGANDVVAKPALTGSRQDMRDAVRQALLPRVRGPGQAPVPLAGRPSGDRPRPAAIDLVAIGVSTGGPEALRLLLAGFTADFPVPLLVVQHMPPDFTRFLAERLSDSLTLPVHEVKAGDALRSGAVWLAPGGHHLEVEGQAGAWRAVLSQAEPENSCRPSVDVLFRSVARVCGSHALGVVLTGMGHDGLRGSEMLRDHGGQIIVQDRASSVVWSMPGAIAEHGLADAVLPLSDLGLEIRRRVGR